MRVAGMSSTLGSRAARELERGDVEEVLVRGSHGYAVMIAASAGTVLLALASREAKLGLIFLDMRRAVEDLRKVV
jgi:predicted regulator of Ras-like GTPase activity (Roadblock/LC7/MglB family)